MKPAARHLPAYALFAALLAAAGLPIYIHAPKFFVDEYGVSLAALGTVLFVLRLLDVVQDPLLGKLSEKLRDHRGIAVAVACAVMAGSMIALFAVPPLLPPLWWFAVTLTGVFSAFSFLTICFYAQGVAKADAAALPGTGHLSLARWRETGALLGVCVASVVPVALGAVMDAPFTGFAVGFAVLSLASVVAMRGEWRSVGVPSATGFGTVLRDPVARRLLLIALLNAAPVAVTSTLFLFYVESALQAPGWEGPLLLLFFLSAAAAAPFWGLLAERLGPKPVLLGAMVLAIVAFAGALTLAAGDIGAFALVCIGSGAALGADLTLLPAMFATRMAKIAPSAAEGFGLWSLVSKFTLAFAAVTLLPILHAAGFDSGALVTPPEALTTLVWLYAGLPCVLKSAAVALLVGANLQEDGP
ncbi:MFS transporter [Roseobacter sp. GAI101]|uniref:MFS transporter n=1 Tax=Roseobacter sp. (strain GAI101) TaxID=391589 RepID=UPI00018719CC|nr:MFS transporter [Roseobacter sp. GAI101]EEB83799.1 sodium:galactoside symporter family protein [Roseobacter sp. GAI101]